MQCSVKPAAWRLYTTGLATSCWNAVTLATRSLSRELMVLLLPTPPLPSTSSVSSCRPSSLSAATALSRPSCVAPGISRRADQSRSPSGLGGAAGVAAARAAPPRPGKLDSGM